MALIVAAVGCGKKAAAPASAPKDAAVGSVDAAGADAGAMDAGGDAPATPPEVTAKLKGALEAAMQAVGVTEACLVIRAPDGMIMQSDEAVCAEALTPASTFKLPNALIGADLGLLDSADAMMTYDAARYPKQAHWPADWAQDHPLRKAMEISAVPLFQKLATEIGAQRMQAKLDAIGYGNRSIAGGIDRFWLDGGMRISAVQQIDFLARLTAGTLPVSAKAHAVLRDAVPAEQAQTKAGATTLKWKTGTALRDPDGPSVGWLVGWIERPNDTCQYACWIKKPAGSDLGKLRAERMAVCRGALERLEIFPAPKSP